MDIAPIEFSVGVLHILKMVNLKQTDVLLLLGRVDDVLDSDHMQFCVALVVQQ